MDSEILSCVSCGFESWNLKVQLCGHVYCRRCIKKSDLSGLPESVGVHWYSDDDVCCYCNKPLDLDNIRSHYDNCEMYPISCNFCSKKYIRCTMDIHVQECVCNLRHCKFFQIGCQFQGTKAEIEGHEGDKVHLELMMNLLLNLQIEQSGNVSMLAHSFNEILSLQNVDNQIKLTDDVEAKSPVAGGDDFNCNLTNTEWKVINDTSTYEETIKQHEMEIIYCKQKISDLQLEQAKLIYQNTQLEHNYDSVKEMLDQHSKEIQNLSKKLELQTGEFFTDAADNKNVLNKKINHVKNGTTQMEKNISSSMKLKINAFEKEYTKKIEQFEKIIAEQTAVLEQLAKQQTDQSDKAQNYEQTLSTMMTANDQLTKAVVEDRLLLNDRIDIVSRKQVVFETDYTRDKDKVEKMCNIQKLDIIAIGKKLSSRHTPFQYIWKFENYSSHRQIDEKLGRVIEVYKFGYKLRLKLYPNGIGDGKGSHLSIFLQVMKGPNDAILNWPIKCNADISALDQLLRKNHWTHQLKSDLILKCYDKPISDCNPGHGIPTFIAFDELIPRYLVDDTMYSVFGHFSIR
uniref:MATH domain-containing protein n=1 Tax=Strigamia maritima TaxID=126957 RepID=T1IUA5_STRMM